MRVARVSNSVWYFLLSSCIRDTETVYFRHYPSSADFFLVLCLCARTVQRTPHTQLAEGLRGVLVLYSRLRPVYTTPTSSALFPCSPFVTLPPVRLCALAFRQDDAQGSTGMEGRYVPPGTGRYDAPLQSVERRDQQELERALR